MKPIVVNMVSESEVSVQGHGVHTAYEEMASSLEARDDVVLIRGQFKRVVECDVLHLHTVGPRTWKKLLFRKNTKVVISAHVVPESFIGSLVLSRLWLGLARIYLRWFYNQADVVHAVSSHTEQSLKALGVKKPITVITNAIAIDRYKNRPESTLLDIRKKYHIPSDAFVVMGAGQTQPRKRIDTFIRVAKELPEVYFLWVGGMPFGSLAAAHNEIKRMIEDAPKNAIFTGTVDLASMPDFYQAADAFFLPSMQETFGLVIVEAAASGLPIVVRDIDDYDTTFSPHVLRCNERSFVSSVRSLAADREIYLRWQNEASILAAKYDSKQAAGDLVNLYRTLV